MSTVGPCFQEKLNGTFLFFFVYEEAIHEMLPSSTTFIVLVEYKLFYLLWYEFFLMRSMRMVDANEEE